MTNTIPQSIIDQIQEKYPFDKFFNDEARNSREAAIWCYGLAEERIKELENTLSQVLKDLEWNRLGKGMISEAKEVLQRKIPSTV